MKEFQVWSEGGVIDVAVEGLVEGVDNFCQGVLPPKVFETG